MSVNAPSYSGDELLGHSLQQIFRDRRQKLPDELFHLCSAARLGSMNVFLHVAPQSNGLRSGDRGGHMKSDLLDISLPGNLSSSQSIAILEVWAGAPSCIKTVRLLTSSESSGKIPVNISVYRSLVTVNGAPVSAFSKKWGPITLVEVKPHQTVT